jgi:LPXTG-motif cell wall-anchored protein
VVEDKADAVTGGTWSEAKVSGPVTIGKDATVKVTVENPITKNVVPPVPSNPSTPGTPATPGNPLAKTGADIAMWGVGGIILLAAGAAAIVLARRKRNRE